MSKYPTPFAKRLTSYSRMTIARLYLSPDHGAPLSGRRRLRLLARQGIEGDRHCGGTDWPGQNLTLIEAEEIEAFCQRLGQPVDLALSRRNIVTRGVRLNALVGQHFRIGDCRLFGVELCEPCGSLGRQLATPDHDAAAIVRYWTGRGGLRADVLNDCWITVGDSLEILTPAGL